MRTPAKRAGHGQAEGRHPRLRGFGFLTACAVGAVVGMGPLLARAALAQEPDQRTYLRQLISMVGEDTSDERWIAAREIGRMGAAAREAVPALLAAIEHTKYASALGTALGRIGPVALPEIREALRTGSPAVRTECLRALEGMGLAARDAIPVVRAHLGDPDRNVRFRAIAALTTIAGDDQETIATLAELAVDEDEIIRDVAARTLADLGPEAEAAIPGLIGALKFKLASQYPTDQVRALRKMGPLAVPALTAAAKSRDVNSASQAVQTLGLLGQDSLSSVEQLARLLRDSRQPVREGAAHALSFIAPDDPGVASSLVQAHVRQPSYAFRYAIARCGRAAVPFLVEALDGRGTAKGAAAQAIQEIGAEAAPAVDALGSILRDRRVGRYSDARREVVRALGAIGAAAGEEAAQLVGDANPDARDSGLAALRLIGTEARAAAPVLRELLAHGDPKVRETAAECLSHLAMSADVALTGLMALLGDANADVRLAALRALEAIGPGAERASTSVVPLLSDESDIIRQWAVRALGSVDRDPRRTLPLFRSALRDEVGHVRRATRDMLIRMGPDAEPMARELVDALSDEDKQIQRYAAVALREMGSDDPVILEGLARAIPVGRSVAEALSGKGELLKPLVPILVEHLIELKSISEVNGLLRELGRDAEPATEALLRAFVAEVDRTPRGSGDMMISTSDGVLVQIGRPAIPGLLRLLRHKSDRVRYRSLCALLAMEPGTVTAEAVPEVLRLVEHENDAMAVAAIELLGKVGPAARAAVALLLRATKRVGGYRPHRKHEYPTYGTAIDAHVALARITGEYGKHADQLLAMMRAPRKVTGEPYEFHRNMLSQRQAMADGLLSLGEPAWPCVLEALADGDRNIRYAACMALADEDTRVWHVSSTTPEQKTAALEQLPLDIVEEWLADPMRREMAMLVIPRLGAKAAPLLPDVIALLDDEDWRHRAMLVIEELGPVAASAVPSLARLVEDGDAEYVVRGALKALGKIGPAGRRALPAATEISEKAERESLRERAIKTMMQFKPEAEAVLPLLLRIATDETTYPSSRQWTAWKAIGELGPGGASAVPAIMEFIREEPQYTSQALETLKAIGPGALPAVDDLIRIVQHQGATYLGAGPWRSRACEVLGNVGPEAARALPVLRWAAHDQSPVVRRVARDAISAVTAGRQDAQPDD